MFEFRDLFQWDRFITPTIIKTFYWLVIALICLFGISGIFSGLAAMAISPFGGFIVLLSSIASVVVGVIFSRIAAEFILIVFRINEHLGAIRDQGSGRQGVLCAVARMEQSAIRDPCHVYTRISLRSIRPT
jgi:predicted membrane metal-binding protein